ncbi:MAG: twin-arginine translocation signal domain-containing protein, partial [SAR202 cluster bacterium]|nr:twin-arginine translocation signal domain-containing protein [SAR202 cluster bacterium]
MSQQNGNGRFQVSRRDFLRIGGATVAATAATVALKRLAFLQSMDSIDNPLAFYPNRDWEDIYRDQ